MLKLLIVDDERFPRSCIANEIAWGEYGIRITDAVENGRKALESIEREQPDVVITDVRMPEMDGMELLKHIRARYPEIDTIIISGYEEFEYVRVAINLGAKNYILKPVDPDELLDAVLRIQAERRERGSAEPGAESVQEFFRDILYSRYVPEQMEEAFERHGALREKLSRVLSVQFDNVQEVLEGTTDSIYYVVYNTLKNLCVQHAERAHFVEGNPNNMVLVILGGTKEELDRNVDDAVVIIESKLRKYSYRNYAIGISRVCDNLEQLNVAYLDAVNAAKLRYIYDSGRVFYAGERQRLEKTDAQSEAVAAELIRSTFQYSESEISRLIYELSCESSTLEETRKFARTAICMLLEQGESMEFQIEKVYKDPANIIMAICGCRNRQEILRHLETFLHTIGQNIEKSRQGRAGQSATQVHKYIEAHYADPNLSTHVVAEAMHFNAAYLSKLFSSSFGMTISSCINKMRIDSAETLLRDTDKKISTIAQEVGYQNISYFCTIFRNSKGCSPSEFRSRERKN